MASSAWTQKEKKIISRNLQPRSAWGRGTMAVADINCLHKAETRQVITEIGSWCFSSPFQGYGEALPDKSKGKSSIQDAKHFYTQGQINELTMKKYKDSNADLGFHIPCVWC